MNTLRTTTLAATLAVLAAAPAFSQDLGMRPPQQTAPVVIVNATIHPVSAPAIDRGYVLFEKGRITSVGMIAEGRGWPAGATVVDGAGKHVWPGLISPSTRLGLEEMGMTRPSMDHNETGDVTPESVASVAVNPDSTLIPVARANGVLAAGVLPSGGLIPGRVSVIMTDGWTSEDMTVRRDCGVLLAWPMMRTVRAPWMDQSDEQQGTRTRESVERIRETFRTAGAYIAARDADPEGVPLDVRWEAMRGLMSGVGATNPAAGAPAIAQRRVFIEAADYDQIVAAVAFAKEMKVSAVIVGGRDAALAAGLLKAHDVPVIFNSVLSMPRRDDSAYDEAFGTPAKLATAGVRFCLASGEETPHERNLPYAAALAAAHGLNNELAMRSITLDAAEILGVADRLGSLEAGKDATLIITDGNPMEATTQVLGAYIQGRKVDLSTKQSELAKKYREKYRQLRAEGAGPTSRGGGAGSGGAAPAETGNGNGTHQPVK